MSNRLPAPVVHTVASPTQTGAHPVLAARERLVLSATPAVAVVGIVPVQRATELGDAFASQAASGNAN